MSNLLLSCIPDAQRIDLSHNTHRCESESLRCFIRERKLATKFPSRAELRLALDRNEIWLLELGSPNDETRIFAAARFSSLITFATARTISPRASDETVAPPFPRHDFGLHLTGVRMGDLGERWRMTWYELSPVFGNMLESRSLDMLMIGALQVYARSAAETVTAVQQLVRVL
jgi:hypothetical protein